MILNPFKCEECERELQPGQIGVKVEDGELVRVCTFCGHEVKVGSPNSRNRKVET